MPKIRINGLEHYYEESGEGMPLLRHSQEVLRRVRGAEAGLIPGAHHGLNMEAPQAFNARVEAFLARLG